MSVWDDFHIENTQGDLDKVWDSVPPGTRNVLEIGVCSGGSLKYWSEKVPPDGLVIGVDRQPSIFQDITGGNSTRRSAWTIERMVNKDVAKLVSDREVYVVRGHSEVLTTRQLVDDLRGNRKFDLYFHDGMHYGIAPIQDWNNLGPLLRIGGTLCVADTDLKREPDLIPAAKLVYGIIGTNQLVYRLPEWEETTTKLSTRQEMVVWTKDREIAVK